MTKESKSEKGGYPEPTDEEKREAQKLMMEMLMGGSRRDGNVTKIEFVEFAELVNNKMRVMYDEIIEMSKMKITSIQTTGLPFDLTVNTTNADLAEALENIVKFYKSIDSVYEDAKVKSYDDEKEGRPDPAIG